ncbi:APO RNA-binding protein (DUF794) isoform X2 [Wolffia australiana]
MQRASKELKKQAQMGIERQLEPPRNGLLVPNLVPVAYEVLEQWKVLIRGLKQLLDFVPVHACRYCSEIHVGEEGHDIRDCLGTGNGERRSLHGWVRGSASDVLLPVESYHVFDPFGHRVKHEDRFNYDRIPAVVELCIQAGVDVPQFPTRRRSQPIRMLGKKIIDLGGRVNSPPAARAEDTAALLAELDTFSKAHPGSTPTDPEARRALAETTLSAYQTVRTGLRKIMSKHSVKACGYCGEVHVGPFGHDVKLCGAFKHQWRDGKHGWQDATVDDVLPPNYVWHVPDAGRGPTAAQKRFYGKAPAVVEVCVQARAAVPDGYQPMMRLDIVIPDSDETHLVA